MKKLMILASLLVFVVGFAATASAVELGVSGQLNTQASWMNNSSDFDDELVDQDFDVQTRLRTQFDFIASENLRAVLQTEIGHLAWGDANTSLGQDPVAIEVRRMFLNFNWPGTEVNITAGLMPVSLPATWGGGNIVLDEEAMAVAVGGAFNDTVGYLFGWTRLWNAHNNVANVTNHNANFDAVFAAMPLTFDGVGVTPYLAYGYTGANALNDIATSMAAAGTNSGDAFLGLLAPNATAVAAGQDASAWWGGIAFEMDMFDPFVLTANGIYGSLSADNDNTDRSGWYFDAALQYTGWDFATPELFFIYTSGEDGNSTDGTRGSERMPVLSGQNWGVGGFFLGGDWYNDNQMGWADDKIGFWALGLSLSDISFMEGLTHGITFMYVQGTNDKRLANEAWIAAAGAAPAQPYNVTYGQTLTEEDNLFEIDITNEYVIYEELVAHIDFSYCWMNLDDDLWETGGFRAAAQDSTGDDAFKFTVGLGYDF